MVFTSPQVTDLPDEVQILQEVAKFPKTSAGIRSFNYQSANLLPWTLQVGGAEGTLPKFEMASTAVSHRQISCSVNSVPLVCFKPSPSNNYSCYDMGGASSISSSSGSLETSQIFHSHALVRPCGSLGGTTNISLPLNIYEDEFGTGEMDEDGETFVEKENLYENHVMHGSHFLCGDLMVNEKNCDTPEMNSSMEMYDLQESMDLLVPEIEINISDGLVHLPNEDQGGIVNYGNQARKLMVKLEKYYYCSKCKHNCFFTPDLVNHFKHCSSYMTANDNYNEIRKIISRPVGRTTCEREVFVIKGVMVKCDKKLLIEDIKLRQSPVVKLDKSYCCKGCDRIFELRSSALLAHLRKRIPCVKPADRKRGRPKSKKPTTVKMVFECEVCEIKFKDETQLAEHVTLVHNGVVKYKCKFCKAIFSQQNLKMEHVVFNHLAVVPGYARFKCRRCNRRFYNPFLRDKHQLSHPENEVLLKCTTCSRTFKCMPTFKTHVKSHGSTFEIGCTDCNKSFTKRAVYTRHLHSEHNKGLEPVRRCHVKDSVVAVTAAKQIKNKINLIKQAALEVLCKNTPTDTISPSTKRIFQYKCTTCCRLFGSLHLLRCHVKNHGDNFEIGCKECTETFDTKTDYIQHLDCKHKNPVVARNGLVRMKETEVEILIKSMPDLEESLCSSIGVVLTNKQTGSQGRTPPMEIPDISGIEFEAAIKSKPESIDHDPEVVMVKTANNSHIKNGKVDPILRRKRSKVIQVIEIDSD